MKHVTVRYTGGYVLLPHKGKREVIIDTREPFPETTREQAELLARNLVDDLEAMDGEA